MQGKKCLYRHFIYNFLSFSSRVYFPFHIYPSSCARRIPLCVSPVLLIFFVLSVRCWFFLSYQCANLISAPSVKRPPTNKRPPPPSPPITLLAEIKWPPGRLFEEIRNSLFPNKGEGGRTPASAKCHITPALSHVVKRQFCRLVLRIYLTNSKHGHAWKTLGKQRSFDSDN